MMDALEKGANYEWIRERGENPRTLFQAEPLLQLGPRPLAREKVVGVRAQQERIRRLLQRNRRGRARAVVMPGPHGGVVRDGGEQALQAVPLGPRVVVIRRAADLAHKQQVAGDEQAIVGLV